MTDDTNDRPRGAQVGRDGAEPPPTAGSTQVTDMSVGIAIGIALGAGIGAALGNVAIGIAVGLALGAGIGAARARNGA